MAHVRLNRNCIYVGGMDFEERGGPSLCGAAASNRAGRCVKIEGEGESWDEGETGFKDYMI